MNKLFCLFVCVAFLFSGIPVSSQERIKVQSILDREIAISLLNASPIDFLRFLSQNYKIPTGIETITYGDGRGEKELLPLNIKCAKCSVESVLDMFVAIDSRYAWSYADGVINVFPSKKDDRVTATDIKELLIHEKDLEEIKVYLFDLPEIKEAVKSKVLTPLIFMSSGTTEAKKDGISLSQKNTTLINVLNEIIKRGGTIHWSIYKTRRKPGYIILTL